MWLERLQLKSNRHMGSKSKAMRGRTVCVIVADLMCTCKVVGFPDVRAVPKLESMHAHTVPGVALHLLRLSCEASVPSELLTYIASTACMLQRCPNICAVQFSHLCELALFPWQSRSHIEVRLPGGCSDLLQLLQNGLVVLLHSKSNTALSRHAHLLAPAAGNLHLQSAARKRWFHYGVTRCMNWA